MLLAIREKAQGWFAWLIVAFISIPFALWGIQSYLGVQANPAAAKVNGEEISQRDLQQQVREVRDRLRSQLGASYRPDMFDDAMLRERALDQMIDARVLGETAEAWKMRIGDEHVRTYIRTIPSFQNNGQFDVNAYNIAVRNQGMSQRGFEESLRKDLVMNQMRYGVQGSAFVTNREVDTLISLRDQEREVAYFTIPAASFESSIQLSDDELRQYYEANSKEYVVPERVKVEYLILDPDVLSASVEVSDTVLRDYYEQHQDEFQVPEERQVRHILVAVAETAEQSEVDAAREKAESLLERINTGDSFADLAREFSEDPGSADQGGDVGLISRGMMAKPFEDKAYELEVGQVSEPVRTPFGFHLIEVLAINAGGEGSFEKLYQEINQAYTRAEGEKLFFDHAERLADLSYENPDSLVPAAENLGLQRKESDWFDRSGAEGELASPKITGAAFSEDVLSEGNNSELIELEQDRVIVLRVVEHEAEQVQPFESVRDQVSEALTAVKTGELAKAEGTRLIEAISKGEMNLQSAAESGGWELVAEKMIKRRDTATPVAVVEALFSMTLAGEQSSFSGAATEGGDYVVIALSRIVDGDPSAFDEENRKPLLERLGSREGGAQLNKMTSYLRAQAEVEIVPQQ